MKKKKKSEKRQEKLQSKCAHIIGLRSCQESVAAFNKERAWAEAHAPGKVETIEKSHQAGKKYLLDKLDGLRPAVVLIDRGYEYFPGSRHGAPREKSARLAENIFALQWARENGSAYKLIGMSTPYHGPEDKLRAARMERIASAARDHFNNLAAGNLCLFVDRDFLDDVCNLLRDIHPVKRTAP
jgi:hypothetical protein